MSHSSIKITLVNHSRDVNRLTVIIFQQNVGADLGEDPVAWQVIQKLGRGWSNTFEYELDLSVGVMDSYGNTSPLLTAKHGQLFSVYSAPSGDQIRAKGAGSCATEIQVQNDLGVGDTNACIYRSGKLLATRTGIAPEQKAVFGLKPSIYIGVVSEQDIKPGQILSAAIVSSVNTQISLLGITGSATIAITGGGPGRSSTPFQFTLSG